jgi:transcriptional regulator with XRE-family HTH domain
LTDTELDAQLDEIGKEEAGIEVRLQELRTSITGADAMKSGIASAHELLRTLRQRLDQPVSWGLKRKLIEVLVSGVRVDTVEEDGVKQSKITVTYRFNEPSQALPLVLPQNDTTGRVIRIPTEPRTIGDHIRRRRLALKLMQKDVATRIGVDETSVFNWEANTSQPALRYMPAVIEFLGYDPLPAPTTVGERIVRRRTALGMSQKDAARTLGVDPSTLARWERGERDPAGAFADAVNRFIAGTSKDRPSARVG